MKKSRHLLPTSASNRASPLLPVLCIKILLRINLLNSGSTDIPKKKFEKFKRNSG